MKNYINENFMLSNDFAKTLYYEFAEQMPIIDFHCHLNPKDIAEDKKFDNIYEIWLAGDHYKWRAMRINGIDEKYITGSANPKEKFVKWAQTVPYCLGNPLYHWTHLELKRYFNIDDLFCENNSEKIWDQCNEIIKDKSFSARNLIKKSNVKVICTTDDPSDSLQFHRQIAQDPSFDVLVLPTFRPDKYINIENKDFLNSIQKLSNITNINIRSLQDLKNALLDRVVFFNSMGCKLSDHAFEQIVFEQCSEEYASEIFEKALNGINLSHSEIWAYKTNLLFFLALCYKKYDWAMQLHIGVIRNANKKMFDILGPDSGFDIIGDYLYADPLSKLLNLLDEHNSLPKTILYCINPRDNEMMAALTGCFLPEGIAGKIQLGSAWWFNDHKDGMSKHMTCLANYGLLSRFIGMLTDSRSFLSYSRHEYFRRILCSLLGEWVEKRELPDDINILGKLVVDICYNNAKYYFRL